VTDPDALVMITEYQPDEGGWRFDNGSELLLRPFMGMPFDSHW
jgi:hypothetical protein